MKLLTKVCALALLLTSISTHAFEVSGESFVAKFEVTSMTSSENGSVMTSEGTVDGYGKVYLTHELTTSMGSVSHLAIKLNYSQEYLDQYS